jgi:Tat protein translocase TatB subunit
MFNMGFSEMLLLAAIALIVVGPKQLPEMARMLGRMINEFRRATSDFSSSFDDVKSRARDYMNETQKQLAQLPESKKKAARSVDENEEATVEKEPAHVTGPRQKGKHDGGDGSEGSS